MVVCARLIQSPKLTGSCTKILGAPMLTVKKNVKVNCSVVDIKLKSSDSTEIPVLFFRKIT